MPKNPCWKFENKQRNKKLKINITDSPFASGSNKAKHGTDTRVEGQHFKTIKRYHAKQLKGPARVFEED